MSDNNEVMSDKNEVKLDTYRDLGVTADNQQVRIYYRKGSPHRAKVVVEPLDSEAKIKTFPLVTEEIPPPAPRRVSNDPPPRFTDNWKILTAHGQFVSYASSYSDAEKIAKQVDGRQVVSVTWDARNKTKS